jgi:hypothetical protein
MGDYTRFDMATADLDQLIDIVKADIDKGSFNNNDVIVIIEGWMTVILRLGLDRDVKFYKAYWIMKRTPPKMAAGEKRSKLLLRALEDYSGVLENSQTIDGDFYARARDAMLNFVWEYRAHSGGDQETDFVHQLHRFVNLTSDKLMREMQSNGVFQMEQQI